MAKSINILSEQLGLIPPKLYLKTLKISLQRRTKIEANSSILISIDTGIFAISVQSFAIKETSSSHMNFNMSNQFYQKILAKCERFWPNIKCKLLYIILKNIKKPKMEIFMNFKSKVNPINLADRAKLGFQI